MKQIFTSFAFLLIFIAGMNAQYIEGPQDGICPGEEYTYTLVSSNANNVNWSVNPFGQSDLTVVNDTTVNITFNTGGAYVIQVYNSDQQVIAELEVFVVNVSTADLSIIAGCYEEGDSCKKVCSGAEMTIAAVDSMGTTDGSWQVEGAESYEVNNGNITVTWGAAGNGSVYYTDTVNRCITSESLCFEIFDRATASINATPSIVNDTIYSCINEEINFNGIGLNGLGYSWDMGDGTSYNQPDITHSYQAAGTYLANFYVDGICECDADTSVTIIVEDTEKPVLECYGSACPGGIKTYNLPDVDCDQKEWSISSNGEIVGGGEIGDDSIQVQWNSGPQGVIEVDVSNCSGDYCKDVLTYSIPVITPDGPISGNDEVCSGSVETYSAPFFDGAIYDWEVGPNGEIVQENGSNFVIVKWDDVGTAVTETVSVSYENCVLKCSGSDMMEVTIKPIFTIESITKVCQGNSAIVKTTKGPEQIGPSVSVDWNLIDKNGDIVASNPDAEQWNYTFNLPPGKYTWQAISNNNPDVCNKIVEKTILVVEQAEQPLGIIGETEICPGKEYSYEVENAGNFGTEWTITDGSNSSVVSGSSISYTFGNTPPYKIEVRHFHTTMPRCSSDSVQLTLSELQLEEITGDSEVCEETTDTFEIEEIGGVEYDWYLTDPSKAEIRKISPTKIIVFFSEPGTTELRVDACGKSVSKTITVNPSSPLTVNHPDSLCIGNTATITTNQSSNLHSWYDEDNSIVGNGSSAELGPGTYSVIFVNQNGCATKKSFTIYKRESPVAEITADSRPDYRTNNPDLNLIASFNSGYTYEWYRNGVDMSTTTPTYQVTQDGEYYVIVTNSAGCVVKSNTIKVQSCSDAGTCTPVKPGGGANCQCLPNNFNPDKQSIGCAEKSYSFDTSNVVPGTSIITIQKYGETTQTVLSGGSVTHEYESPGIYEITFYGELINFDYQMGFCSHYDQIIDTVEAVADFEYDQACVGDSTMFYNRSRSLPFVNITSYDWNFDDPSSGNNTSNKVNPAHVFNAVGDYDVNLEISTDSGCSDEYSEAVESSDGPDFQLSYDSQNCEQEATAFSVDDEVFDVSWDFDDPGSGAENSASKLNVMHTYASAGSYQFTVTGKDVYGCENSETGTIDVYENNLSGDITAVPSNEACKGNTIDLEAPSGGEQWSWNNGDTTEQISVEMSGQYSVVMTDDNNCTYEPDPIYVNFQPKPILNAQVRIISQGNSGFWQDSIQVCYGTNVQIGASSDQSVDLEWEDGSTADLRTFAEANGNLLSPGVHTFIINGEATNSGCEGESDTVKIEVLPPPSTPQIALTAGNGCSMNMNTIEVVNPQSGIDYVWSTGHIGLSIVTSEDGEYYVAAINDQGCKSQSSSIVVQESPEIGQIPSGCLKVCELDTICLPMLDNIASYTIYKDGTVYDQGTDLPQYFVPDEFAEYFVEVTADNGCTVRSEPLNLEYEPAYGTLRIPVYLDINQDSSLNNSIDALLSDIQLNAYNLDKDIEFQDSTLGSGYAEFENVPSGKYLISFNRNLLDSMYFRIIDSVMVNADFCNADSVVLGPGLLAGEECSEEIEEMYSICPGDSVEVHGETFTEVGEYMVADSGYCDTTYLISINFSDLEVLEIDSISAIEIGSTVPMDHNYIDSVNYTFEWTPPEFFSCSDCPDPVFTAPDSTVMINLTVESDRGCVLEDSLLIEVINSNSVYIPNAFSPNGDNVNDFFRPLSGNPIKNVSIQIYNRWGDRIYEEYASNSAEMTGWNGDNGLGAASAGVYMYYIKYETQDGVRRTAKGDVTLLR